MVTPQTVKETVPAGLLDTPALQHLLRQPPNGARPVRAPADDHVVNHSILNTRGPRSVPQPRRAVAAGGGQQPPVRAERHAPDVAVVAGEGAQGLAGGRVP